MKIKINIETVLLITLIVAVTGLVIFLIVQTAFIQPRQEQELITKLAAQSNEYNALKLAWRLRQ